METCSTECETHGLELRQQTGRLLDSGVFGFSVELGGLDVRCEGSLYVFGKFGRVFVYKHRFVQM